MTTHVSSVCRAGFFHLRQLRSVRRSLTTEATRTLVQAFISCRLDYCNSVLAGVPDVYLQRLQSLQNAAARLVSGARRHDHITPVLVSLHWLPVCQRISYNTAVLVWKCLHDADPRYLADLCMPAHSVRGRKQLRSTASGTLLVPRARTAILVSAASPSMDHEHGTVCQPILEHQIRLCALSSVISRHTCFSSSLRC